MMYPFLTLNDDTEIVHSEMLPSGEVRVYIERPDARDGFHSATCFFALLYVEGHRRLRARGDRGVSEDTRVHRASHPANW